MEGYTRIKFMIIAPAMFPIKKDKCKNGTKLNNINILQPPILAKQK